MIRAVDSKSSVRTCFIIWSISIRATICMGDYMAYWHEVYTGFTGFVCSVENRFIMLWSRRFSS